MTIGDDRFNYFLADGKRVQVYGERLVNAFLPFVRPAGTADRIHPPVLAGNQNCCIAVRLQNAAYGLVGHVHAREFRRVLNPPT